MIKIKFFNKKKTDGKKMSESEILEKIFKNKEFKKFVDSLEDRLIEDDNKIHEFNTNKSDEYNTTCPKCSGHNIVDKLLKGKEKNEVIKINKCKDCDNEYEKSVVQFHYTYLKNKLDDVRSILKNFKMAKTCEFNPMNSDEIYFSLEEKRDSLLENARNSLLMRCVINFWKGTNVEMFNMLVNDYLINGYSYEKDLARDIIEFYDEDVLINELGFVN